MNYFFVTLLALFGLVAQSLAGTTEMATATESPFGDGASSVVLSTLLVLVPVALALLRLN